MLVEQLNEYTAWLEAIHRQCKGSSNWKTIDDWCYSTMASPGVEPKLYHLCRASHQGYLEEREGTGKDPITEMKHTRCVSCNEVVPEGLKMIVLLLESNI